MLQDSTLANIGHLLALSSSGRDVIKGVAEFHAPQIIVWKSSNACSGFRSHIISTFPMFQSTVALSWSCCLRPPVNGAFRSVDGNGNRYGTSWQLGFARKPLHDVVSPQNGRRMVFSGPAKGCRASSDGRNGADLNRILRPVMVTPLAASMAIILWVCPAQAGVLSGLSGLKSIPGPELPNFDFLQRIQEENQKKYEANDARFKSSALLEGLLKRSKANAERHKQEIQDKYCLRGAEIGVGDCSTIGMSTEEREAFLETLRKKVTNN